MAKLEFYGSRKARLNDIVVESDESIDQVMQNTFFLVCLASTKLPVKVPDRLGRFSKEGDGVSCRFPLCVVKSEICLL